MITDAAIQSIKRKAQRPDHGGAFFKPDVVLELIEAYEEVRAERDALADERDSMYGYDLAQIWAEHQEMKWELERIRSQFPAGQMEIF